MKTQFKLAAIFILGFIAIAAASPEKIMNNGEANNESGNEEKIRNIIENQYPEFVGSGDAGGYAGQFTEDAFYIPPGASDLEGPEEIANNLKEELKTMRFIPVITIKEISVLGDYAYVIGKGNLKIIPRDGSDESNLVYTLFWLLRKEDNQWKIARQIWNEKPITD